MASGKKSRVKKRPVAWRMQTDDEGGFDELVLGKGLHVEMMDDRTVWIGIYPPEGEYEEGDRWSFSITFLADGTVRRATMTDEPMKEQG